MKIQIIGHNTVMQSVNDSIFSYFAWPSVARLQDGRLAAVSSGFRYAHICPFGKAVISYSSDEGKTWTAPAPVIDTPLDDRDAGVMPFGDNQVILTSFNNSVQQQRIWADQHAAQTTSTSTRRVRPESVTALIRAYLDNVTPEQEAKYLGSTYKLSHDGGTTWEDEVRISPLTAPHGPVVINDGRLMYVGKIFANDDCPDEDIGCGIGVMMSADGVCWTQPVWLPKCEGMDEYNIHFYEPHGIQLPSGKILVHIRAECAADCNGKHMFAIYQSESTDGGKTFSVPVCVNPCGSPPHLMLHSSGALVSVYGYRTQPYGQRAMVSWDEGATWERDIVLRDDGPSGDLGYPASVELNNGHILTVYYQRPDADAPSCIYSTEWTLEK